MLALLAPVLVLGLVIFVHELGHFLAAKAMGVYAPRFSHRLRAGALEEAARRDGVRDRRAAARRLRAHGVAPRRDGSAFLEGGSEEQSGLKEGDPGYDPDAMVPFGPRPCRSIGGSNRSRCWPRLLILFAGVTMNAVLALVVAIGLSYHFGRTVLPTRVVGAVHVPAGGSALAALQPGDTIFRVNGDSVGDWSDILSRIALSRANVTFGTQHGDVVVPLNDSLTPLAVARAVDYWVPPVVDSVLPGGAAAEAGLEKGDSIAAINGVATPGFADLVDRVSPAAGSTLVFTVWRQGKPLDVRVTPQATPVTDPITNAVDTLGRIGVAQRQDVRRLPVGFAQAVATGASATWVMGGAVIGTVHDLITRKVSVKELGGPIAITRASVQAARNGVETLFYLIALLSINVAVLNLLPIPILDGGQIVVNVIETAKGSPFSARTRENILRFGLVVIALLFALVMFNDTRAWLGHFFQ